MIISNVKGQFAKVEGVLTLDSDTPEKSRIVASIDAASLATRDSQRDAHLRSADFFDAETSRGLASSQEASVSFGPANWLLKET